MTNVLILMTNGFCHHLEAVGHFSASVGHFHVVSSGFLTYIRTRRKQMRKIIVLLLILFWAVLFLGADVVPFPDLQRPASLKIHKDRVFINDGAVIYIHSLRDFKLLNRFGGEGEGPQEFKVHPNINKGGVVFHVQDDHIIVSSIGRVSYFTGNGRYIKEMNPNTLFGFGSFVPFGKSFVAMGIAGDAQKQYYTFNFYNDTFQKA